MLWSKDTKKMEHLLMILTIIALFLFAPIVLGAPWLPTPRGTVHKMLSMAEVKPDDVVYDLGSGDGRILISAVRRTRARAVGIEVNPLWVLWTRLKIRILKVKDYARVVWGNFFREDLSKADIVMLYLLQNTNDKLKQKLERELRPGARVVSHTFTFNGWNPVKIDAESKIYIYKIEDKNHKEP